MRQRASSQGNAEFSHTLLRPKSTMSPRRGSRKPLSRLRPSDEALGASRTSTLRLAPTITALCRFRGGRPVECSLRSVNRCPAVSDRCGEDACPVAVSGSAETDTVNDDGVFTRMFCAAGCGRPFDERFGFPHCGEAGCSMLCSTLSCARPAGSQRPQHGVIHGSVSEHGCGQFGQQPTGFADGECRCVGHDASRSAWM